MEQYETNGVGFKSSIRSNKVGTGTLKKYGMIMENWFQKLCDCFSLKLENDAENKVPSQT